MKPTLVVNPANDEVFAEFAELLLDDDANAVEDLERLERRLRKVYPNATIHERQLSGELALIWYIYREGRWISSQPASSERGLEDDDARARRGSEVDS